MTMKQLRGALTVRAAADTYQTGSVWFILEREGIKLRDTEENRTDR